MKKTISNRYNNYYLWNKRAVSVWNPCHLRTKRCFFASISIILIVSRNGLLVIRRVLFVENPWVVRARNYFRFIIMWR